ncbi:putative F-box protein [Cardamine amara subsp. amara]|uniref:F-box protein n=1 Tax=Cardamine amara subsp. amara TaxID=228776 RepID=A0ABD1BSJ9_CARAN
MASSGNWLLMVDSGLDFYIFNLLTCKRINLTSIELGHLVEPCRKDHLSKEISGCNRSAVLWIDERRGGIYVVAWILNRHYLFIHKKGDDSWWNSNMENPNLRFSDLAYRNSKLYLYTLNDHIKIIDFSRDYPKEVIEENPYWDHPFHYFPQRREYIKKRRIAIQKSGEVLIIMSLLEVGLEDKCLFYIFKMNLERNKWERVDSIGDDEMLIFGHGVTIRAPVQDVGDGLKNGSIFFVKDDVDHLSPRYNCASKCGVFDLATSGIKLPKKLGSHVFKTQWFFPGFA